ncbi:MAG: N,N'-diacetyllegionaminic acid synthase [Alphaproteobacteria bacterium MarineAlpha2_Bin1]|nr:MAG: N,N'-diacetyllegionaminic acid synthase [Alphaproteobacteria bacterium MarineAlpha2_Bin1]|tara:strand:- start:603 stop:1595 length:993 start_codon:yes stop_codon:yes gene_type:complete
MVKIIAEIGSVHDGSFGNACKLIEAAAEVGADVVKFQTHIANEETLKNAPSPSYFTDEDRYSYFERTSFSLNQWAKLKEIANKNNLSFLSSPFSIKAVDILESINIDAFKIASGEVTNLPLIEKIASTKKEVYISTGMSNFKEIDQALNILKSAPYLTVMQCSSIYPCPPEKVGINVIELMKSKYSNIAKIGFSDHTLGFAAGISAIVKGAEVIEKHLTLSNMMYGSDAANAMEVDKFKSFVKMIRETSIIINSKIDKNDISDYKEMKKIFEKSIVASRNIPIGKIIEIEDLNFKKPGTGISASKYKSVINQKVKKQIQVDQLLSWDDLE